MTAPALSLTFADLTQALSVATKLPPRVPAGERLATAWRGSLRQVDDAILFIRQYQRTIAEDRYPRSVENAQRVLPARLAGYLAAVRRVSEFEERMIADGIQFKKRIG